MTTSLRESDAWSLKSLIATTDYKQTNYIVIVMKSYTVTWWIEKVQIIVCIYEKTIDKAIKVNTFVETWEVSKDIQA